MGPAAAARVLLMLVLAIAYVHLREERLVAGLLFGVKAAALAAIAHTTVRWFREDLRERRRGAIAAGAFVAMVASALPVPVVIAAGIAVGLAADALKPTEAKPAGPPNDAAVTPAVAQSPVVAWAVRQLALGLGVWIVPLALLVPALGREHVLVREAFCFGKASLVAGGGIHGVLACAAQPPGAPPAWATAGEMLDGLGLGLAVAGPSLQAVPFFGFLAAWRNPGSWPPVTAGLAGALTASWAVGLPAVWASLVLVPRLQVLRGRRRVEAVILGARSGLTGVVAALAIWLATHLLFAGMRVWEGPLGARGFVPRWWSLDLSAVALTAVAYLALARWNWGPRATLLASAGIGLLLRWGLGVL